MIVVLFHIVSALSSVLCATYSLVFPSKARLRLSYGLVAATIVSGSYLAFSQSASLSAACVTGIVYLSAVALLLFPARHKLAQLQ